MATIVLDRRLSNMTGFELREHWHDLAFLLHCKVDPTTQTLPPRYQEAYDRVRDEFAKRGVQLRLF